MQSVAAVGPAAEVICGPDPPSSFDPVGPFAVMLELDTRGLLLGAPMQSFSLVHLAEERAAVSYRYWKDFTAAYGPESQSRSYRMYVRDLALDPRLSLAPIEDALVERGLLAAARVGSGWIKGFATRDFLAVTLEHLERDPYWLLSDRSNPNANDEGERG